MEITTIFSRGKKTIESNRTSQLTKRRLIIFLTLAFIFFGFVLTRLLYLGGLKKNHYTTLAKQNKNRISWREPSRGIIFDRNKKQLVYNEPQFRLVLSTQNLPETESRREKIMDRLKEALGRPQSEIRKLFKQGEELYFQSVVVKENLKRKRAIKLRAQFSDLESVQIKETSQRSYKNASLTAHILGYTSLSTAKEVAGNSEVLTTSQMGRKGLEKSYNELLHGTPGKKVVEVDTRERKQQILKDSEPKPGKNLILTLDLSLQKVVTEELEKILSTENLDKAAAVAVDPKTGDILALVSLPSFDNNNFNKKYEKYKKADPNPLLNRVVQKTYPPGSTFKPLVALAALEEGVIAPENTINCPGQIKVGSAGAIFKDWRPHGKVDFKKAIAQSCNVYFYTIGGGYEDIDGLGIENINAYAEKLGFKNEPPIDLPHTKEGLVPTPTWKEKEFGKSWYKGDTYNVSIGQGALNLTPLHINNMMSFYAEGGKIYSPHLMKKVLDQNGNLIEKFGKEKLEKPKVNSDNIKRVRKALRETVLSGTAEHLKKLPVKAAGKTGTAQFGGTDSTHGWFSGFAPYREPEIVLTVLIEGGGGSRALPVLASQRILKRYFNR